MKKISAYIISAMLMLAGINASAKELTIRLDAQTESTDSLLFRSALDALNAVNLAAERGENNVRLLVSPGVYWIDDPDDPAIRKMDDNSIPFGFTLKCDTLSIIATDGNPENTIFAVDRGQTRGALGNYTMFHFIGRSLRVSGMTFGNYCNVDLVYPLDPAKNRNKRSDAIVQGQLGICRDTDRLYATDCRFISRLNLCPFVGARRSLYQNCYFECTDDALSGSGVYLDCDFTFYSSKPFYNTPKTGAVFLNCDITLKGKAPQYLTKVPGPVTMIDTRFHTTERSGKNPEIRWSRDMSANVSYYNNVTLDGALYAIDGDRGEISVDLTGTRALEAYKVEYDGTVIYNTPNLLAGDDAWDPQGYRDLIMKAEKQLSRPLLGLPVRMDLSDSKITLDTLGETASLNPRFLLWGGYAIDREGMKKLFPMSINYNAPVQLAMSQLPGFGNIEVTDRNMMPQEINGYITAVTDFGLQGISAFNLAPTLKEAPVFTTAPSLKIKKGVAAVTYNIENPMADATHFEWYSTAGPDWSDSIPLRHGSGRDFASFTPTGSLSGRYIGVVITPKNSDSKPGESVRLISSTPLKSKDIKSSERKEQFYYSTDFSDIPVRTQPKLAKGAWAFDTFKPEDTKAYEWEPDTLHSWYYGRGTDAATGVGLVQWTRGARTFYSPGRETCRNMSVSLELEPCKSAGQGFGSATGQYLDIYIKYNPTTLSGYGLRIERTSDYDHAVVFTLMRFENGKSRPLTEPVASSAFRTPCHLTLSIDDGRLSAHVESGMSVDNDNAKGVVPEVNISTAVPDTEGPAVFGMQHTGTTGASATLISNVTMKWN